MYKKTLSLLGLASVCYGAPAADKVDYLPGMDKFSFNMYSGYLPIGSTSKSLHYQFAESQRDPVNDPVIIWFNGGPGCSSMLGFIQEHGPYVMESGTDYFHYNEYSWNTFANVLYIESPGGVGYSICSDTECNFDDDNSAQDNLQAILYWYESKFPEYKLNDLYISGESYAGIYVPYVANQIDEYNSANTNNTDVFKPNLKGFMVGNGVTNWDVDTTPAYVQMGYWHGLYDLELYNKIQEHNCEAQYRNFAENITAPCIAAIARFEELTSNINIYNVYGTCWSSNSTSKADRFALYETETEAFLQQGESRPYKKSYTAQDYTPWAYKHMSKNLKELPPCTFGDPIIAYFNNQTVRDLLHIPNTVQPWDFCTEAINYTESPKGSQWVYEKLQNKYRIMFYSGDVDGAVPTYGTLQWINQLNWDVTEEWRPYFLNDQVAGFTEAYDGLTLITVHGAGHMVPQDKRPEAYYAISNWIANKTL